MPDDTGFPLWVIRRSIGIQCACGCGTELWSRDRKGRPRRYLHGHYTRVSNPGFDKIATMPKPKRGEHWRAAGTHWRTARTRARSITEHHVCEWAHIGHCQGRIEVAHVDGDFTNQSAANRKALCTTHHRLLDHGRIDPNNPVMPPFYVDRGGKRRYRISSHPKKGTVYICST